MKENIVLFEELNDKFNNYIKRVKQLYDENINSDEWHKKLKHGVDYRPIYPDAFFQNYWDEKVKSIRDKIQQVNYNDAKEVCEVYAESVDVNDEYLHPDYIGTILNHIREFYGDLECSLIRLNKSHI